MKPNTAQSKKYAMQHVSISDSTELRYWCKQYDCSEKQLKKAIEAVGPSIRNISAYLRKKPLSPIE